VADEMSRMLGEEKSQRKQASNSTYMRTINKLFKLGIQTRA
jgi:hypothetical protein